MPHILLVDDDDLFRNMLRLKLMQLGYHVTVARHGREALALHGTAKPDLVLTDLIMPEMEGVETIQQLKRRHAAAKIIAMSGGGQIPAGEYLKIAKCMGADRVLTKPFSNEALKAALDACLEPAAGRHG